MGYQNSCAHVSFENERLRFPHTIDANEFQTKIKKSFKEKFPLTFPSVVYVCKHTLSHTRDH